MGFLAWDDNFKGIFLKGYLFGFGPNQVMGRIMLCFLGAESCYGKGVLRQFGPNRKVPQLC